MTRYSIDRERETLTFIKDEDTGETETARLEDLIESLMWLRSRERELRALVFERSPLDLYQRMHLVNGYYIGQAVEKMGTGQKPVAVKVTEADFTRELQRIEKSVRFHWASEINEKRSAGYVPIWNANGTLLNEDRAKMVSEEQAPDHLVYEAQQKVWQPEYWQHTEMNLDRGKPTRFP